MNKHTPLPWKLRKAGDEANGDIQCFDFVEVSEWRYILCEGRSESEANANAAYIVRACNAYPKLVEALKEAIQTIRLFHGMGMPSGLESKAWTLYQSSPEMKRINAALREAGEEL